MILVIGSQEEYHSKHIYELLKSKGEKVCYFDTRSIPEKILVGWHASESSPFGTLVVDNKKIKLNDIKSVYWRWHYGIALNPAKNDPETVYVTRMMEREIISAVDSLFSAMGCLWVNSINAIEMHKKKSYQLYVMAQNGIRVPKTLITNNKDELMPFFKENNGLLIYKPVRGGAHTEKVKQSDFSKERLEFLKYSPVQFQEFIDGVDIRTYVIGDKIFSAEIRAKTIDFRSDANAEIVPVELPDSVKEDCFKIMNLLDLKFSGIDIRRSRSGEYVFIEANPSPMFTYFEEVTGFPISKSLVDLLVKG